MNFVSQIKNANNWIENNTKKGYIPLPRNEEPYFEVTGYFIPTLINFGFKKKAQKFGEFLVENQFSDGSWSDRAFDTAQVLEGLCKFNNFNDSINKGVDFIKKIYCKKSKEFKDKNLKSKLIPQYINFRSLAILKEMNKDISIYNGYIEKNKNCDFNYNLHFYAYAFEGLIRLNINTESFVNVVKKYNGLVPIYPDKPNEYCYTGLSQIAMCLFMINEFDLGMKVFEFVSKFQNNSGGFLGSSSGGGYFPNHELSWAVKFYLDAFFEAQKCSFKNKGNIWKEQFEGGENDSRLNYVKSNVKENDKVLDIGCGAGRYINRLNCEKYACDLADMSKKVQAKFSIGSCTDLPYEDNTFDKVICCECLEHVVFKDQAIDEMLRVIRSGGQLLIIDKDFKFQENYKLDFGEEWVDFDSLKEKHKAEITKLDFSKMPFIAAKIQK